MNNGLALNNQGSVHKSSINWHQVGIFLGLTFAASYALDLVLWLTAGYGNNVPTAITLQARMLMPAFFAILLSLFIFKNSPIYFRNYRERPRWFFYFFLLFTLTYLLLATLAIIIPTHSTTISAVSGSINILGLIFLVALRIFSGREAFAQAGLVGGKIRDWVLYGLAFILFYTLQTGMYAFFNLGEVVDQEAAMESLGAAQFGGMPVYLFLLLAAVQTILIGPILGLLLGFGEEYGWRAYLQGEILSMGKKRAILLIGLIWGIWHYPVIWMGHNYPGEPVWGTFLMTVYTILLAFVLGYVMLKTGAVLLVAYLHALNNQVLSYLIALVYKPGDPIFSYGTGLFGLAALSLVVLLLFRDPIWKNET